MSRHVVLMPHHGRLVVRHRRGQPAPMGVYSSQRGLRADGLAWLADWRRERARIATLPPPPPREPLTPWGTKSWRVGPDGEPTTGTIDEVWEKYAHLVDDK